MQPRSGGGRSAAYGVAQDDAAAFKPGKAILRRTAGQANTPGQFDNAGTRIASKCSKQRSFSSSVNLLSLGRKTPVSATPSRARLPARRTILTR
jgi:hypothetical protein